MRCVIRCAGVDVIWKQEESLDSQYVKIHNHSNLLRHTSGEVVGRQISGQSKRKLSAPKLESISKNRKLSVWAMFLSKSDSQTPRVVLTVGWGWLAAGVEEKYFRSAGFRAHSWSSPTVHFMNQCAWYKSRISHSNARFSHSRQRS
jgi:hypothetical protein